MARTLFLAHRIPFPPDRGDKIRSHHLLKAAAGTGPVHVATFAETPADRAQEASLAAVAASYCVRPRRKPLAVAGVEALLTRRPVSLTAFADRALAGWVADTIRREAIDTVVVFSGQMGQYVPANYSGRLIFDLCDVDSAKFEAYAAAGERRWLNAREGRLLAREEARLARRADATLLISEAEAALFRARAHIPGAEIVVVGNGIDTDRFSPDSVLAHPALDAPGPQLVFTGQMDYRPNVEAMIWAAEHLMPALRATHTQARLHIVGRAPTEAIRRLDGIAGTRVWGEVADVRPFLAGADTVLAPLAIARGVQNKVLEAMAMARPTVLTQAAATGIEAPDGSAFRIAPREPEAMALAIGASLGDSRMGTTARQWVRDHASWDAALAPFVALLKGAAR